MAVEEERRGEKRRIRAIATISTSRNESESGSISHEISATAGMRNTATWALDASAISAASLIFPRWATMTAPPCSAAFPTIATMTAATKKSDSPNFVGEGLERVDERLGHEGGDDGRRSEHGERCGSDHAASVAASSETCCSRWRRSEYHVTPT